MVVFMVRWGSRLQKLTESGVYILTVRFNAFEPKTEIIIVCNGRDRPFEKK